MIQKNIQQNEFGSLIYASRLPSARCGIAAYASQEIDALKAERLESLTTLGLTADSDSADLCWQANSFKKTFAVVWALKKLPGPREICINYTDSFFLVGRSYPERLLTWFNALLFFTLTRFHAKKLKLIVHELLDPSIYQAPSRWFLRAFQRAVFHLSTHVEFHTESEKQSAVKKNAILNQRILKIRQHGAYFRKKFLGSQAEARKILTLSKSKPIFLSIGFVSPHKGMLEIGHIFSKIDKKYLYIVGVSQKIDLESIIYAKSLRSLSSKSKNVFFIENFVSDKDFDCWVQAADVIILNYKHIYSSGVLERAILYDKPIFYRKIENLDNQIGSNILSRSKSFSNDEELLKLIDHWSSFS